jgi:hypothetical protein
MIQATSIPENKKIEKNHVVGKTLNGDNVHFLYLFIAALYISLD